jgi:hypothetical protein
MAGETNGEIDKWIEVSYTCRKVCLYRTHCSEEIEIGTRDRGKEESRRRKGGN